MFGCRENETQIKAILATAYTFEMSPYVGVICMFFSWIFFLYHMFRLSGGINVLIIQRVFGTAIRIWVQKKKINPHTLVAQKVAGEVAFRRFQGEEVEFFKSKLTNPPQFFDADLLENANLSPSSFHFSVSFYI